MSALVETARRPILLVASPESEAVEEKYDALAARIRSDYRVTPYPSTVYGRSTSFQNIEAEHRQIAQRYFQKIWFFGELACPPLGTILALALDSSVTIENYAKRHSRLDWLLCLYCDRRE